jgi:hypothetical protein
MDELTKNLIAAITTSLYQLEEKGSIVITESIVSSISQHIAEGVKSSYAGALTPDEVLGVCSVLLHAAGDANFYDWEMPTLSGYQADEVKEIATRLRNSVNI